MDLLYFNLEVLLPLNCVHRRQSLVVLLSRYVNSVDQVAHESHQPNEGVLINPWLISQIEQHVGVTAELLDVYSVKHCSYVVEVKLVLDVYVGFYGVDLQHKGLSVHPNYLKVIINLLLYSIILVAAEELLSECGDFEDIFSIFEVVFQSSYLLEGSLAD